MKTHRLVLLVAATSLAHLASGCSGGGGGGGGGTLEHHHYVVSGMTIPADSVATAALGFDLDGDDEVDNQFGQVMSAFVQAAGAGSLDVQGYADAAFLQGAAIVLADLGANDLESTSKARLALFDGENPSPAPCTIQTDLATCGQHLAGTGSFDVAAGGDADVFARGSIDDGTMEASEGELALTFPFLGALPSVSLLRAHVELDALTETGFGASRIGGLIPEEEIGTLMIPSLQVWMAGVVAADCGGSGPPGCGCDSSSAGETLIGVFDEDQDCDLDTADLETSSLISTLLRPDVDTDGDSTADALSLGVGVTGVAAVFTDPE